MAVKSPESPSLTQPWVLRSGPGNAVHMVWCPFVTAEQGIVGADCPREDRQEESVRGSELLRVSGLCAAPTHGQPRKGHPWAWLATVVANE